MAFDVCLVGPSEILREGLSHILNSEEFNIIGSYSTVSDIEKVTLLHDLLIIVDCPELDKKLESVEWIKSLDSSVKAVVLSDFFDMKSMIDCFDAGADGYITKSMKALPLIMSLRLAALGEKVLPSELVEALRRLPMGQSPNTEVEQVIEDSKLSHREFDVLCCLMAGYPNKLIARHLDVCEATVKVHVKSILRKLHVQNRTQAAIWANSHGISEASPVHDE